MSIQSIDKIADLVSKEKPVAILGLGHTGLSYVSYCIDKGWPFFVMDSKLSAEKIKAFQHTYPDICFVEGEFDEKHLLKAGLLLLSPGIDSRISAIQSAKLQGIPIVNDIELFVLENAESNKPVPIIAVTGSNGKSTVCDCLHSILNTEDYPVEALGNIGKPVLDYLAMEKPKWYILELSSFQLENLQHLPLDVAVILNISPDHLDRHGDLKSYVQAKHNIFRQANAVVYNQDDGLTKPNKKKKVMLTFGCQQTADFRVLKKTENYVIEWSKDKVIYENDMTLKGIHNALNIAACLAILKVCNIPVSKDILEKIQRYSGLPHRCQWIPSNDGVMWINDSKATNLGATETAIQSYAIESNALYLIAGGDAKGSDLNDLSSSIQRWVKKVWVFGKDAHQFMTFLPDQQCEKVDGLTEAVKKAKQQTKPGDRVLFSPACASIDMYRNYQERGEHFISLVTELAA